MNKKKTGIVMLLTAGMMLSLVQCGGQSGDNAADKTGGQGATSAVATAPAEAPSTGAQPATSAEAVKQSPKEAETAVSSTDVTLTLEEALENARVYIDDLTINSPVNAPGKVVSTWGRYFTWDNEKREDKKPYLYEWSYYNSVVFEGLDYIYDVTGDTMYSDYVTEYLSSMIESDGSWTQLANGPAAGYNKEHGLDCYKTASLLLDYYDLTGEERYLTVADTLYQDLIEAKEQYSAENIGGNYYHTWASAPEYAVWLDGLYMSQPFMAEYAARFDEAELDNIASRFAWIGENMYNPDTKLYYHAAGADKNSGGYWLRSIGWYAAAMADVMDYMEGDNLTAMQTQLEKLLDGMKAYQDSESGMWSNYVTGKADEKNNRLETSGTALLSYAIMKAVNNGWLDDSYADMGLQAFTGICANELDGDNLSAICFKGAPGSDNATFYDNEGKGAGPFIMAYAEVLRYSEK